MRVEQLVHDAARAWPDAVAIRDERGPVTYAELAAAVDVVAAALTAGGVRGRQGVALVARNGRDFVVGLFAALQAGAVVMPMSHQLRRHELLQQLEEVGPAFVVDDGAIPPVGDVVEVGHGLRMTPLAGSAADGPMVPHVPDAAFVRFTSGTTGAAKGVVLGHAAVLARTAAAAEALRLAPGDVVAWVLPMAYHFVVSVVAYVRAGATVAVAADGLGAGILDVVRSSGATVLYAAPMHYRMMAAEPPADLSGVRLAISTSTGLPDGVSEAFEAVHGVPVRQVYGIIELGLPLGDVGSEPSPTSVGAVMPGYAAAILDDDGRPVADGEVGHLGLRGPGTFDAYLKPPLLRDAVLRDGWFMTGDLAVRDDAGRIVIAGRRKSMINVSGHKVFPEEVEGVLLSDPTVAEARVFGAPHPLWGEVVHAEVTAAPGAVPDVDALRRVCRDRLSAHKVPQRIAVVEALPMTRTGKVARDGRT